MEVFNSMRQVKSDDFKTRRAFGSFDLPMTSSHSEGGPPSSLLSEFGRGTTPGSLQIEDCQARVPPLLLEMNKASDTVNVWSNKMAELCRRFEARVARLPPELRVAQADEQLTYSYAADRVAQARKRYQEALDELEAISEAIHRMRDHNEGSFSMESIPRKPKDDTGRVRWRRVVLGNSLEFLPVHPSNSTVSSHQVLLFKTRARLHTCLLAVLALFHLSSVVFGFFHSGKYHFNGPEPWDLKEMRDLESAMIMQCLMSTGGLVLVALYLRMLLRQPGEPQALDFQPLQALEANYAHMQAVFLFFAIPWPGASPLWSLSLDYIRSVGQAAGVYYLQLTLANRVMLMEQPYSYIRKQSQALRQLASVTLWSTLILQGICRVLKYADIQMRGIGEEGGDEMSELETLAMACRLGAATVDFYSWIHFMLATFWVSSQVIAALCDDAPSADAMIRGTMRRKMKWTRAAMLAICAMDAVAFAISFYNLLWDRERKVSLANLKHGMQFLALVVDFATLVMITRVFDVCEFHFTDSQVNELLHNVLGESRTRPVTTFQSTSTGATSGSQKGCVVSVSGQSIYAAAASLGQVERGDQRRAQRHRTTSGRPWPPPMDM